MRLILTILTLTVLLSGCEKQREQVEKFVFDSKQIASRQIHIYEFYDDGKIKIDSSVTYHYLASVPFDTIVSKDVYEYTDKGKVKSIISLTDSSKRLMTYNEIDSLTSDFRINQTGDTTLLLVNEYQNGKPVRTITRMLSARLPTSAEDIKIEDLRSYDTLLYISEMIYNGDQIEKSISKDAKGNITGENESIYEDGREIKSVSYSFIGTAKYISETTNYIYGKGKQPDYITANSQGDTISFQKTVFQDDMRIVTNYFSQVNSQDIWYYDKQNRLVGNINLNLTDKIKFVYSYKYDDKGNKIEEVNYKERLSNAR
jgi:hypothetical protein